VLRTDELDYDLPKELIATAPADRRDEARLLVISRSDPGRLEHRRAGELAGLLAPGDLLVFNRSRVTPARLVGRREDTGGRVQGLYLGPGARTGTWRALIKARRFRAGAAIRVHDREGEPSDVVLRLVERDPVEAGAWIVEVESGGGEGDEAILARVGRAPLPPYILAARRAAGETTDRPEDLDRYQTVYAAEPGSVAAPTAGLHFTPELLARLDAAGIARTDVTLHVGTGTFKPVETETVEGHEMHAEWCSMSPEAIEAVMRARDAGRRVIPVGTTAARTLESYAALPPGERPDSMWTDLLITPGYGWRWCDGLLTNFHLPRSTLLAMVASLLPEGPSRLLGVYAEGIRERYRFYSYGDAMLILP